jgi:diguanylate cyclase (GGDEF)-like protein
MTITRKVSLFFISLGVLLSCIATGYVAHREYQVALDSVVDSALARALNRPDLQLYFYRQDEARLKEFFAALLESKAATAVIAYSNLGDVMARSDASDSTPRNIPSLEATRVDFPVAETGLIAFNKAAERIRTGFWSTLTARESTIILTIPIFSPVDPNVKGNELSNLAQTLIEPGQKRDSLVVLGYLNLAIDSSILLREARLRIRGVFLYSIALVMLCALAVYLTTKKATASLGELKDLATHILSGEDAIQLKLATDDEFTDIARVLNSVTEKSAREQHEAVLDHKLLVLKADERAAQLSIREQQLSKATEEISATREELHRLANYDRLTTLPNRQLFIEQLELLLRICARNAKPLALLFLNLDEFHRINESLGRSGGDSLLQEVAKRLVACLRSSDILSHYVDTNKGVNVSRIGGDEFAVVLGQLDSIEAAGFVAQRIVDRLIEPMTINGNELVVKTSIGIAIAPRNGMDAEVLLRSASTAMHGAKSTVDSSFLFYREDMEATHQDDLKLESELRKAIDRGELSLHYQPQVDTTNGSVICAEALLRWENAEFGQVSPAQFIPLAEKMGLIWELGDWVLVEACRQMKAFKDRGLDLPRIAINISPQQFKPAFVTRVRQVLLATKLPPSMLELGLSEVVLMDNDNDILKFLQELKETGVYLSLENFGTNHAPIGYLGRHPLDEIKIDRSFVLGCDTRKDAARLIKAIIAMAKSLNLHIVAEGVETAGQYQFLVANGVNIMRGYLFSKPVPAAELQQLLVVPWHFMSQLQRMALIADLKTYPEA